MPLKEENTRGVFAPFDEDDPQVQFFLLTKRFEVVVTEKEQLEEQMRDMEGRMRDLERAVAQGNGLDADTHKWLKQADKTKLEKIDAAIQFMSNAEFMGKWTWRGITGFIVLSGGFFAAFKFWKG